MIERHSIIFLLTLSLQGVCPGIVHISFYLTHPFPLFDQSNNDEGLGITCTQHIYAQKGFLFLYPSPPNCSSKSIRHHYWAINNRGMGTPRALFKHSARVAGQRVIIWWLNNKSSVKTEEWSGHRVKCNYIILTRMLWSIRCFPSSWSIQNWSVGIKGVIEINHVK